MLSLAHTNTVSTSRLPTTQYEYPVYVEVPQIMGSLITCKMCTHYVAQCWKQVPQEFGIMLSDGETETGGNFWLSYGAPRNIRTVQVIT